MKKLNLFLLMALYASFASAEVSLGLAAGEALIGVAIRGVFAFFLFKLVTLGLTSKTTFRPIDNGRYISACWGGLALISTRNSIGGHSDATLLASLVINTGLWMIVGFVSGYVWRLVKPLSKPSSTANEPIESPSKPSASTKSEELIWDQVANEFSSSNRKEGLWAKCFAEADGNESKAKAIYLKTRSNELMKGSQANPIIESKTSNTISSISNKQIPRKIKEDKPPISTSTVLIGLFIFAVIALLLAGVH